MWVKGSVIVKYLNLKAEIRVCRLHKCPTRKHRLIIMVRILQWSTFFIFLSPLFSEILVMFLINITKNSKVRTNRSRNECDQFKSQFVWPSYADKLIPVSGDNICNIESSHESYRDVFGKSKKDDVFKKRT